LDHILQIIRLSNIIEKVPRRKRLEILAKLYEQFEQYSVHELCEAFGGTYSPGGREGLLRTPHRSSRLQGAGAGRGARIDPASRSP